MVAARTCPMCCTCGWISQQRRLQQCVRWGPQQPWSPLPGVPAAHDLQQLVKLSSRGVPCQANPEASSIRQFIHRDRPPMQTSPGLPCACALLSPRIPPPRRRRRPRTATRLQHPGCLQGLPSSLVVYQVVAVLRGTQERCTWPCGRTRFSTGPCRECPARRLAGASVPITLTQSGVV